jgi:hypothetical protein
LVAIIATYLNQTNHLANQQQVLGFGVAFSQPQHPMLNAEAKPTCFAFSSSKIYCTMNAPPVELL